MLHTLDLPQGNRTEDAEITRIAEREGRVLISKDNDFVNAHLLHGRPQKLLLISTGNMANADLERLVELNLDAIVAALASDDFVELGRDNLIVHD